MPPSSISISDIPPEVFTDNLLPLLSIPDLLRLTKTSRFFARICNDETFWKRKLEADFNFGDQDMARTKGSKFIYSRFSNPRVFVWGEKSHGRLGLSTFPESSVPDVPFPTELKIPGVRIVSLVAGGLSFHALDSKGSIFVWGTLGDSYPYSDGFSRPGKVAYTPLKLQMPVPTKRISCGRFHASSLDSNGHIWTFVSWGRPFRFPSASFNPDEFTPVQVECGWEFSAALSNTGDVLVWWPFQGELASRFATLNRKLDNLGDSTAPSIDGEIPCVLCHIDIMPTFLKPLPALPELEDAVGEDRGSEPRLIQLAGCEGKLLGLTDQGHVLLYDHLGGGEEEVTLGSWQYLPKFSKVSIRTSDGRRENIKIAHITACFRNFTAYSSDANSVVLMGDINTTPDSEPKIIPELQHKSVISVVMGDYHNGAITSDGKLFIWGAYSNGALGLGDPRNLVVGAPGGFATRRYTGEPPPVKRPAQVRFDRGSKSQKHRFCVSAAAGGWHTGALVVDLENDDPPIIPRKLRSGVDMARKRIRRNKRGGPS